MRREFGTWLRPIDINRLTDKTTNDREVKYASKTKSSHWEYEKEWRQYITLNAEEIEAKAAGKKQHYIKFDDNLVLREVIIGAKSEIKHSCIKNVLCRSDEVKIHTAIPSLREYKMVID